MQFIASDEFQDLKRLHTLKLDGNLLPVVLEKTFIHQKELKYLCLARNRLAKITNTAFLNLSNLVDLDIGYNKLDKLEMTALHHVAETLQRLVISGNQFSLNVIKDVLNTVYKLRDLEMAQMNLKTIPRDFFPDRIKKLNLSKNNLTEIELKMLPKALQEFDLSLNKISYLEEDLILKFEELHFVNLSENPWSCTLCDLGSVIFRLNRTNFLKNLTCASPRLLRGRTFFSLNIQDLSSCDDFSGESEPSLADDKLGLAVGIISLLVFLIVCVMFVIYSCMQRRVRHSLHEQKRMAEHENTLDGPTAIFAKGEISFKFPLDLTERKVSVSTIDEIKKDTQTLPNGTGI